LWAWSAAAVVLVDLVGGTALVALNQAEQQLLAGGGSGVPPAVVNLVAQGVLLLVGGAALVWRTPRAAWLRSSVVAFVLIALSLSILAGCLGSAPG
jgi:hypothetical protein